MRQSNGKVKHGQDKLSIEGIAKVMQNLDRQGEGKMITGWKDISKFFGVSVTTVKRWYYYHQLPIGRTPTGKPCIDPDEIKDYLKELEAEKDEFGLK